ncbi:hypothetical protein EON64_07195 [archaeon]|nr:MAG: hypothetical protein EON64_07195 [archaeon]
MYSHRFDVQKFFAEEMVVVQLSKPFAFNLGWQTVAILAILVWLLYNREKRVYLLDFATFDAPDSWKVSQEQIIEMLRIQGCYTEQSLSFMDRMLKQSGTGNATAWPPGIVSCLHGQPQDKSIEASRKEAEVNTLPVCIA